MLMWMGQSQLFSTRTPTFCTIRCVYQARLGVTRAVLGEFVDCQLRETNLDAGNTLVDRVRGTSRHLRAAGGLYPNGMLVEHEVKCNEFNVNDCDCADAWFECRIPKDIPAGAYPMDLVLGSGQSQAITGSGRALFEPFGGVEWSPELGTAYALEIARR